MKELSLREIQLAEFGALKRLKEICDSQNLKYYIIYGTLLGAVRHKGFIPWDDDVDVMMFRDDYEKLVSYCNSHMEEMKPFRLHHYSNNKKYIYPIARFSDTRYYVDYNTADDYDLGMFVDIYPFDGCGNDLEEMTLVRKRQRRLIVPVVYGGLKNVTPSVTGGLRTIEKYIIYYLVKLIGVHHFVKLADKGAQKVKVQDSKYVENTSWELEVYKKMTKEDYGEGVELEFEGETFRAPVAYDKILKLYYKNYMELPPEEDRVGHHYYKAYLKDSTTEKYEK